MAKGRKPDPLMEGRMAYRAGLHQDDNPYEPSNGLSEFSPARQNWFSGFFDEWRWSKYGPNPGETLTPLDGCTYRNLP